LRLLHEPEVLDLELQALLQLAKKGLSNFSVMMPMAHTLREVEQMVTYLTKTSVYDAHPFEIWVKCETPSMAILMEELCELPISGICFEVPSLGQLILGIDKTNRQIGHHLDQTDPAVLQSLEFAIGTCHERGVSTLITAELEHLRPEVVQAAIHAGVTGISVEAERLVEMHNLVAAIEKRMVLDHLLLASD